MKEYAEKYIRTYEGLDKWIKFVLNFLWAIPTNLYRFAKSAKKNDVLGMIVSVILIVSCGFWVLAVFDFVTIAIKNKVYWLDDVKGYEGVTANPNVGDAKPEEKCEDAADKEEGKEAPVEKKESSDKAADADEIK